MNKTKWLEQASADAEKLRSLLGNWHPASTRFARRQRSASASHITAQAAEMACAKIRAEIQESEKEDKHPTERFDAALKAKDVGQIISLLNSAWFGVPESSDCWLITGFSSAVALLEDPPED